MFLFNVKIYRQKKSAIHNTDDGNRTDADAEAAEADKRTKASDY